MDGPQAAGHSRCRLRGEIAVHGDDGDDDAAVAAMGKIAFATAFANADEMTSETL